MKNIIVAGGQGLLGKAIVKAFADSGMPVRNIDINGTDIILDLTEPAAVSAMLHNYQPAVFVNTTYPQEWGKHLRCYINCTQAVADWMSKNGGGVIVNLASIYGIVGPQDSMYTDTEMSMPAEYAAVKGAIIAHSRCLAVRYANRGVRINCISPGGVQDNQPSTFIERYSQKCPMGRMATAEEIADVVCFLASDKARYITGINLAVDGGWTAI